MKKLLGSALLVLLAPLACSDDAEDAADGQGTVSFTTWGEEYIEQEIPPSADGETIVEDGWTIKYTKFVINLSELNVSEEGKTPVATLAAPMVFDMHAAGVKPVASFANLPAKPYTRVSYAIAPATAASTLGQGATDADKALLTASGYSIYVEGSATKDAVTKTFKWGFSTNTLYEDCKGELSGKETEGAVVTNGGVDEIQLTIHGDHFFYDDLQSGEAKVRFGNIAAADANADGEVTLEELATVDLADKTKITAGPYGTGSATGINDLRAFVESLSRTLGHFRGEGECLARSR